MRCVCLGALLSLLSFSAASGQSGPETDTEVTYWIQGGPAATTLGVGMTAGGGLTIDRHVFSLRGVNTDPVVGGETWEVAFLYGRATVAEPVFLSAGAGVSVVGGTRYPRLFGGDGGEQFDPMIGFPLEGHLAWTPVGTVSLGLYAFANVNTAHPLGGLGILLRLGPLR